MKWNLVGCLIFSVALYTMSAFASERNKENRQANVKGYSFETCIPQNVTTDNNGIIAISSKHIKHGNSSLEWSWRKQSVLTITDIKPVEGNKVKALRIWIYNENPVNTQLTFQFGDIETKVGKPVYEFEYNLNYRGWRAMWVQLDKDTVRLSKIDKITTMIIKSPAKECSGKVFFDIIDFVEKVDGKRSRDFQVPFINKNSDDFWQQTYRWSLVKPDESVSAEVTEKQKKDFDLIYQRYKDWFLGKDVNFADPDAKIRKVQLDDYIATGVKAIEKYKMVHEGNIVNGVGLFASLSPYGPKFSRHVIAESMLQLLFDYRLNGSENSKRKLLDVFDYLNDQGWAYGSACGSLDHELNRSSSYMHTVVLFKEELAKAGKLDRELATMGWYIEKNEIYEKQNAGITADRVISHMLFRLLSILAMPDSSEKLRDMKCFNRWVNNSLSIAPGWAGLIKPDYVAFHHKGHYGSAYGTPALQTASLIIYLLHGTEFAINNQATDNVKQALLTVRDYSNLYDMPTSVMGRFPFSQQVLASYISAYAYMALASEPPDTEMVAVFKRLWKPENQIIQKCLISKLIDRSAYFQTMGSLQLMQKAAKINIQPEKNPSGHWSKNYGALAIHRRDDWMVTVKGTSKYIWDYESHKESGRMENMYGRYMSCGAMQIIGSGSPVTAKDSGYIEEGWDWNLWPGATVIYMPIDELSGAKTRNFTDKSFVGGLTHNKTNGIFVLDFHDTIVNPSFEAKKSYFFFDDLIVCLGSGICNNDNLRPTKTVLFQGALPNESIQIKINSFKPITDIPFSQAFKSDRTWLIDAFNNGYYIAPGQNIVISRSLQYSKDDSGEKQTTANFAAGWIEHGVAPQDAGYEYAIKVKVTDSAMMDFAAKPEYEVIQKDNKAHIVRCSKLSLIGYAIFDSSAKIPEGVLVSVSNPLMVMLNRNKNHILMSFCDPDLRLVDKPISSSEKVDYKTLFNHSQPKTIYITIKGKWELEADSDFKINFDDSKDITIITSECKDGFSYEVVLKNHIN